MGEESWGTRWLCPFSPFSPLPPIMPIMCPLCPLCAHYAHYGPLWPIMLIMGHCAHYMQPGFVSIVGGRSGMEMGLVWYAVAVYLATQSPSGQISTAFSTTRRELRTWGWACRTRRGTRPCQQHSCSQHQRRCHLPVLFFAW